MTESRIIEHVVTISPERYLVTTEGATEDGFHLKFLRVGVTHSEILVGEYFDIWNAAARYQPLSRHLTVGSIGSLTAITRLDVARTRVGARRLKQQSASVRLRLRRNRASPRVPRKRCRRQLSERRGFTPRAALLAFLPGETR